MKKIGLAFLTGIIFSLALIIFTQYILKVSLQAGIIFQIICLIVAPPSLFLLGVTQETALIMTTVALLINGLMHYFVYIPLIGFIAKKLKKT